MKISLRWLREFLDLPEGADEVARVLTRIGLPVEAIETTGAPAEGFVVGRVVAAGRHPNADKLTLCTVDVGTGELLQIVCGAPNAAADVRAAVALVGAVLPDGTKIKKAKLRGVESQGMLCSERELGLSEEHKGIIDLGPDAPAPGTPLAAVYGEGDSLLHLEVPSNRGDCWSHVGVARELSAALGRSLRRPESPLSESGAPIADRFAVAVEDADGCPRYLARLVDGVSVGPSPEWLAGKIRAIGQRPISNVVDVTNLILWEMGQPLHAFDAARLAGGRIVVRRARAGETLTTLDGQARTLTPEVLVIADGDRAVALAGLMGGADSEVTASTTSVLLEAAVFDSWRVLRGTADVRLTTDAALRFIRGVDPSAVERAIDRAAALIAEVSGGTVAPGRIDVSRAGVLDPARVTYTSGAATRLLGETIGDAEAAEWLSRLGLEAEGPTTGVPAVTWRIPSHRRDLRIEADLVEEVARHHGYDNLTDRDYNLSGLAATRSRLDAGLERLREAWIGFGFQEALTPVLVDPEAARRAGVSADDIEAHGVAIPEPQSREESLLRMSLLPGLLKVLLHNRNLGAQDIRLFEVGPVFRRAAEGPLADEPLELVAVARGGHFGPDLTRLDPAMDEFRFKGVVEAVLERLRVDTPEVRCYDVNGLDNVTSAIVLAQGVKVGELGRLHPDLEAACDTGGPVYLARFFVEPLLAAVPERPVYRPASRFPASRRDLAFLVDRSIPEAEVAGAIRRLGGDLVRSVVLFDRFVGPPLPEGKVSLAYSLTVQSNDRTLSDEDIRGIEKRIAEGLAAERGAELRDG
jgi:phenylalanyl-tRNA synthetase beta chain